jgi:hypothetical protein
MNSHKIHQIQNDVKTLPAYLLPIIIIIACVLLALEPELRLAIPLLIGVTAVMTTALAFTLYYGSRGRIAWSSFTICAIALVLRLLFLFAPPQLSDDIYRYLWDGGNLLHGINPYAFVPADVRPSPALAAIHSRINHPDYVTIYPPAAQILFAGGASLGGTITGIKGFLVLLDMGLCILLVLLLKRLEMPVWLAVLYAWNPLPVLEIAGSGHVDGAGLVMLIGSFCLIVINQRSGSGDGQKQWPFLLSGALAASAGLVKLFPFVLAPVLFLLVPAGRRMHFVTGFTTSLALLIAPFLPHLTNIAASLDAYARDWEFAGFAFNTLRTMTGSGIIARQILSSCFLLVVIAIILRLISNTKRAPSPVDKARHGLEACYAVAMALLLLTPTLHPWYALCLAVFLPFCPGPAGLALCWSVFLTYQVQISYFILGQWIENPQVTASVFLAPVTAFVLSMILKYVRQTHPQNPVSNTFPQDRSAHP